MEIDSLLNWFKEQAEQGIPIPPYIALEKSQMLNSLASDLDDKIVEYRSELAKAKAKLVEDGFSVAKAIVVIESFDVWKDLKKLEAKRERVTENIRIAKMIARVNKDQEQYS